MFDTYGVVLKKSSNVHKPNTIIHRNDRSLIINIRFGLAPQHRFLIDCMSFSRYLQALDDACSRRECR